MKKNCSHQKTCPLNDKHLSIETRAQPYMVVLLLIPNFDPSSARLYLAVAYNLFATPPSLLQFIFLPIFSPAPVPPASTYTHELHLRALVAGQRPKFGVKLKEEERARAPVASEPLALPPAPLFRSFFSAELNE